MSPRSWSFLTVEGIRQYGGNVGYLDDPAKVYRYDSDVANHLRINTGDIVVLRSKVLVIGIARIAGIVEGTGDKERLRCPECKITNIKERVEKEPHWKCKNGHVFNAPMHETVKVSTFEAHYADSFRVTPPNLTIGRLLDAVIRPSDQMSIKEINLGKIDKYLLEDALIRGLIVEYADSMSKDDSIESEYIADPPNSIIEIRRRVLRDQPPTRASAVSQPSH